MRIPKRFRLSAAAVLVAAAPSVASANIIGQHAFSWWDDPQLGVFVTNPGAGPPAAAPNATHLLDLREWHLDQAQTMQWYQGNAIAGLPANPFNAANRTALIGGIAPVAGAEAFIYELTNVNYMSGNGPVGGPPFSFTDPAPPGPGVNDLSGINIVDLGGALNVAAPIAGSQFMFTTLLGPSQVLDMTPGSVFGVPQDWDFNAYSGAGNFEWDIRSENGAGVVSGLPPAVFGFAMPGNWIDQALPGWVHSWDIGMGGPPPTSTQVNLANTPGNIGFSGPGLQKVPEPATLALFGFGVVAAGWLRRRR